jgi:hypothetical protein
MSAHALFRFFYRSTLPQFSKFPIAAKARVTLKPREDGESGLLRISFVCAATLNMTRVIFLLIN